MPTCSNIRLFIRTFRVSLVEFHQFYFYQFLCELSRSVRTRNNAASCRYFDKRSFFVISNFFGTAILTNSNIKTTIEVHDCCCQINQFSCVRTHQNLTFYVFSGIFSWRRWRQCQIIFCCFASRIFSNRINSGGLSKSRRNVYFFFSIYYNMHFLIKSNRRSSLIPFEIVWMFLVLIFTWSNLQ